MLKNKLFLIVLLFVFLFSHGNFNSLIVKASDEKLNTVEPTLLHRPNYDGRIVFSSNARGNNYNLYVADAGGGDLHEITHEPGDEINPSISLLTNIASSLVSQNPDIDVFSPISFSLHNFLPYLPIFFLINEEAQFKMF